VKRSEADGTKIYKITAAGRKDVRAGVFYKS
jgi:hypothetical protein